MTELTALTEEVAAGIDGDVGVLELTRPRAINSLTRGMCEAMSQQLRQWESDDGVSLVEIRGTGPKGLCAGGDVVAVRQAILDGEAERGYAFFDTEFGLDEQIAGYAKPTRALQRGVVMGGGLGISAHCTQRLVFADARIAMPETIIGYFPDVGMLWRLGQAPGECGAHLALTGTTINAADAITVGFADRMAPGEDEPEPTLHDSEWMRECYAGDDAAQIIARLERHAEPQARAAAAEIRKRSPLSVWAALWGLRRAQQMDSLADVFAQDRVLARASLANPDFVEGVRAQLVDKDRHPRWRHRSIEEVPRADVEAMFAA